MFTVPMQNLFGAGLLLTLVFSIDDHSSVPEQNEAQAKVQLACDDGGFSHATRNAQDDTRLCREVDFR